MGNEDRSGAGTRPMTSGGADNIGAGDSLAPGGDNAPAPTENMSAKRQDARSIEQDDSAPWGMTESAEGARADKAREPMSDQERAKE